MKRLGLTILCLVFGISFAISQTQNVKGLVVDEANDPVIGATVSVKGTTLGAATDLDGNFSLSIPQGTNNLEVSYMGYEDQTVKVAPIMKIVMKPSSVELTTVEVVGTGMVDIDRRLFSGASDRLKAEDVMLSGLADASRALEGRSGGVTVQNVSGTFGTAPKIQVRGATSIYGSSKPLWVVDGVIMEDVVEIGADDLSSGDAVTLISSAIAGLNADDIESFQILKDGSATSIYGARAMAGVIVVTTKKGRSGVNRITYSGEYTLRLKPSYNEFNIMNSQEQMGVYKEMQEKGWLNFAETYRASASGVYGKMYQLLNTYDKKAGQYSILNTPESRNAYLRQAEMRNTDWFDELFETNIMHNHSVSVTSGTDKTSFYGSLSALMDPGWSKQSTVKRYTANMNVTHKILNNLSINLISGASYRKQKAPGTIAQDIDAVNGEVKRDFDINPYSYALNTSRVLDAKEFYTRNYAKFNIMHELENNYLDLNVVDMRFQGEMKWKVIPELELSALGAIKYSAATQEHSIKDDSNQASAYRAMEDATIIDRNPFLYRNPDNPYAQPISILPSGGIYKRRDSRMYSYDFRTSAKFNKIFEGQHITSVYAGLEVNRADRRNTRFDGWGTQYNNGEIPFYMYEFFKQGVENNSEYYALENTFYRSAAFFGTGTYSYQGKYSLTGTIRYEGTNSLGRSRSARWLPTWNISTGWNVHEEKFFESWRPTVSHLSFRAGYSLSGDRPRFVSNSQAIVYSYKPYRPNAGSQENGLQVSELENSELTYEKKHELNVGIDAGFLNNRLNFSMDVYRRNMYDLIGLINTAGVGGEISKYDNIAEMKSSGIDFTISSRNIKDEKFTWNTDFVFGHNTTEITDLDSRSRLIDLVSTRSGSNFAKGYPQRALFSIRFAGLNEDGIPTFYGRDGEIVIGEIDFQDRQNVTDYLKYEGPADPTFNGSLQNSFGYKNFKLNVFITYAFGNKIRLDQVFKSGYDDLTSMPKEFKNRWVMSGDESYTNVPTLISSRQSNDIDNIRYAYNAYNFSDKRVADGGFIRMKEISLAYDFPKKWLGPNVSNLSLKVQATNLFLIYSDSKLNGQDPEFFRSGGVASPIPRQFTMTLRLGL